MATDVAYSALPSEISISVITYGKLQKITLMEKNEEERHLVRVLKSGCHDGTKPETKSHNNKTGNT